MIRGLFKQTCSFAKRHKTGIQWALVAGVSCYTFHFGALVFYLESDVKQADLARIEKVYNGHLEHYKFFENFHKPKYPHTFLPKELAFEFSSLTSDQFKWDVIQGLKKVPSAVQEIVKITETHLKAGKTATDMDSDKLGIIVPRSDPSDNRVFYNQFGGYYSSEDKTVRVAERTLRVSQHANAYLRSPHEPSEKWLWEYNFEARHTTLHEVGHALSYSVECMTGVKLSACDAFKKAYDADIALLSDELRRTKYGYFAHPGKDVDSAREETCAELLAQRWGSENFSRMKNDFKNCYEVLGQFVNGLEAAKGMNQKIPAAFPFILSFMKTDHVDTQANALRFLLNLIRLDTAWKSDAIKEWREFCSDCGIEGLEKTFIYDIEHGHVYPNDQVVAEAFGLSGMLTPIQRPERGKLSNAHVFKFVLRKIGFRKD